MAYSKAQLEALKNSILASAQPITAAQHRSMVQNIIDEMYDAQSRGNLLAGVQADASTVGGDTVLLIRGGQAYLVPATLFGGSGGTLAGLGDVLIVDPQDEDILSYDLAAGKWKNIPLTGLFVTQDQLDAALDALQLPEGARLISAELLLTSDTAGTITAQWVDFLGETESVTAEALAFNGGGLPGAGNFRFDIVQGANDGTVNVKEGTEADAASVVVPSADADHVVLVVVLWAEDGTAEVSPPGGGNAQQNVWSLVRQITPVTPGSAGLFSKVWEGNLSAYDNYSLSLAYAEPKDITTFEGSGFQILKVSFTCTGARDIVAETVQIETGLGSTAGEFVLYQIAGNKAALYHKSNHYWGRIQYRVLFQNSQVRLQDFVSNSAYGAAPSASATFESAPEIPDDYTPQSGTILSFGGMNQYGFNGTPETGNITFSITGALERVMIECLHNSGTEPSVTAPGGVTLWKDAGDYVVSEDNILSAVCKKNTAGTVTIIRYSWSQNQL